MKTKTRNILIFSVAALLMAAGIYLTQEYRFYNIEGSDLFLYDRAYISDTLCETGGFALLAASFDTQFMRIPFAGPLLAAMLYFAASCLIASILRRKCPSGAMDGFAFIPAAFMFLCLENGYFRYWGHMAFVISIVALWWYVTMPEGWKRRLAAGLIGVPLLYHLSGSAAIVFAVGVCLYEITDRGVKGLWSLAFPAVFALTAFIYVRTSMVSGWAAALTPFMYYSNPSTYFFPLYAWASVPALILASWIFSRFTIGQKNALIPVLAGIAVSFFIAGNLYSKVHSEGNYRLLQEEYLADNEDWGRIVETADRRRPTYFISYLNLALAEQGHLLERFPYFNPQAISGVMPPIPNIRYGMSLQSKVYLAWGYVAAARQSAFDANMMTPGMRDPRQLKILVQTNLATGSYEVAEKYLDILERTLMYRKWAKDMRRFLDDPEKVAAFLPAEGVYVRHDGLKGDLEDIVSANPSQRIALQFLEVYKMMEGMQ